MEKTAFDNRYHGYLNVIENYLNGLFVQENHWTDLYRPCATACSPAESGCGR